MKSKPRNVLSSFKKSIFKIRFDQDTIEYAKFMFLANQLMKFCIGGENLDTKLQVLPFPRTFRVYVYNNVRYIQSCTGLIMIIRYGSNFKIPGHFFSCINLLLPCSRAIAVEWVNDLSKRR